MAPSPIASNADVSCLITESASLVANGVIAALMVLSPFGSATVAAVAVCTFLAAGVMSIDSPGPQRQPARSRWSREHRPRDRPADRLQPADDAPFAPARRNTERIFDPGTVYAGSLIVWAGILPLIAMLRYHSVGGARSAGMLTNIRAGVAYTRRTRAILAVLSMVLIVQLLGMPVATPLGPMFMMDVLKFSSRQVGFMGATWGIGAFAASVAPRILYAVKSMRAAAPVYQLPSTAAGVAVAMVNIRRLLMRGQAIAVNSFRCDIIKRRNLCPHLQCPCQVLLGAFFVARSPGSS